LKAEGKWEIEKMGFKSSEDSGKGSENSIMILFPRGRLQVPLFQTSGIPLEEENNCFSSQYLKGGTTLDLAVPYGPNFLSVPIHSAEDWNSAGFVS
jgi:hypothetical protein